MKKALLMSALFAAALSVKTFAQGGSLHQNAIKLNPLSLIFATGNISYERAVNENQSFQIGGYYSGLSIGGLKYSGFGVTPEYRIYFGGAKQALNGVYVGPFVRYQSFKLTDKETTDKTTFTSFGGGAILGWEKSWNSGFVLDLFAGPGYNAGKFKNDSDDNEFDLKAGINGFGVRTGITLGFAF
jgi:hypothetical protein